MIRGTKPLETWGHYSWRLRTVSHRRTGERILLNTKRWHASTVQPDWGVLYGMLVERVKGFECDADRKACDAIGISQPSTVW
jgi:hypothetical protein